VLGTDGKERRVALQPRLDQKEGTAGGGANDTGRCATEHVDGQRLGLDIVEYEFRQRLAHRLVKAETAAVEENLVNVGRAQAPIYAAYAFISNDD